LFKGYADGKSNQAYIYITTSLRRKGGEREREREKKVEMSGS
jgi:hypothetical protein